MQIKNWFWLGAVVVSCGAWAGDVYGVDFEKEVRPVFEKHCYKCHGEKKQKGGLRLDNRKSAFLPADSGEAVIVAGKAEESILFALITSDDKDERMPPKGEGLSDAEITLIKKWISQGAQWDDESGKREKHWAYVKPVKGELPKVDDGDWGKHVIDRFTFAKMKAHGLGPSSEVSKAKLIRRVYLDLIGLPPSIEAVEAFVKDERSDAYERVVAGLLESKHYGERWAINWLDLARHGDSNGFQRDGHREVWAYRDYVIKSFNADKPFDEFVVEQIAGDLLPGATLEQRIATGFNRGTTVNVEAGVVQEANRVNQIFDRVNTLGIVFLGTTFECAQCHNHKYDPFTQQDYYRMFAYFNNTPIETKLRGAKDTASLDVVKPNLVLPLTETQKEALAEIEKQLDVKKAALTNAEKKAMAGMRIWERDVLKEQGQAVWSVLGVKRFVSKSGASGKVLADGSVLVGGKRPDKDVYEVELVVGEDGVIGGVRLDTLTDESLPGKGPGRHHKERPNFVMYEFEMYVGGKKVKFGGATADFSQKNYDVKGAVDGKLNTGWAINPEFHKPHYAEFELKQKLQVKKGDVVKVVMHQGYGETRTIGRFKISVSEHVAGGNRVPGNIQKIIKIASAKRNAKQQKQLKDYYLKSQSELVGYREAVKKLDEAKQKIQPRSALVLVEMSKPRDTFYMKRGDYRQKGAKMDVGTPEVLHRMKEDLPRNRLGLAKWLADKENPLLARVTVNRWWAELFGRGIVGSLEDFGTMSEPATHRELLDWLAVEFMESGWSMKHIHKLMVMSKTYRQDVKRVSEFAGIDPENKYLWRGNRIRLHAELIRDNALVMSGLLSEKMYGPVVYPPQPKNIWRVTGQVDNTYRESKGEDKYRRGIYTVWRRSSPYPAFINFDAPNRSACTVSRARTNTPLQALTLLNDATYSEMTIAFAKRVAAMEAKDDRERVKWAFGTAVAREPNERELWILERAYEREYGRFNKDVKAAKARVGDVDHAASVAAWYHVCKVIMNLDETITRD